MTYEELKDLIADRVTPKDLFLIMSAVEAYTAASNGAKPIVSGSLQCEHLPMIDTGVGYYHCPACGWSKKVGGNDRYL
jgi:uncharacterized protein (UPF0212 family)